MSSGLNKAIVAGLVSVFSVCAKADSFLTGTEILDLYKKFTFCYGYSGGSCRRTEVLTDSSPQQFRIQGAQMQSFTPQAPKDFEDFAYQVLFSPRATIDFDVQTFTLWKDGICRTKSQSISDADMLTGVWIRDVNNLAGSSRPYGTDLTDKLRAGRVKSASQAFGNVRCYHYKMDPNGYFMTEYVSVDGALNQDPNGVVRFLKPNSQYALLLRD